MKQSSRTLLAGHYVLRCLLLCETTVKESESSSVKTYLNIRRVLENPDLLGTKLVKSKPLPYQRSRVRPIPKSCCHDRTSRDLWNIETARVIKLSSLTRYSSTVVLFRIGEDP